MPYPAHSNYPDGCTAADIDALCGPDPVELPAGTAARVKALVAAIEKLTEAAHAMIAAGDDFAVGDLFPEEWIPDPVPTVSSALAQAQAWAENQAEQEAEYLRDVSWEGRAV